MGFDFSPNKKSGSGQTGNQKAAGNFLSQAAAFLQERKKHRIQTAVFLCLAVTVAFGTVAALKMYGEAMTHKVKVLDCGLEVHEHTEDCYEKDEEGNPGEELICGYADYVIHVHNDDCYDTKGGLVCQIPEREPHTHTEECVVKEKVLACGLEETLEDAAAQTQNFACGLEEHRHMDSCYQETLTCKEETHTHDENCYSETPVCQESGHVHGEDCYTESLTCTETGHSHGDSCYDGEGNLTCELEENAHEHGAECYTKELTCGQEESAHEHGAECYTKELTCGQEETAHAHGEECYTKETDCGLEEHIHTEKCAASAEAGKSGDALGAGEEAESKKAAHVHTEECYAEVETYQCGELELHTHEDVCYEEEDFDEDGNLIEGSLPDCGLLQLEEHVHAGDCFQTVELTPEEIAERNLHVEHDESCYDEEGSLVCAYGEQEEPEYYCGKEEHEHNEECYDADGNLSCELEEHTHDGTCLVEEPVFYCGKEEHVHVEACYDEAGNLICELEEHTHDGICLVEEPVFYCGKEEHTHGEGCYDEAGNLTCELEEHTHDESCLEEPVYYCGKEEHTHGEECHDENGNLTCEVEEHVHSAICLIEEPFFYCGLEEHVHVDGCYDADGNLTCELEEHVHEESCLIAGIKLVAETEDYFIVLEASADAFPDAEGKLVLEAVKLAEDSEEYKAAVKLLREKTAQEEETEERPFEISVERDGEEVPETEDGISRDIFDIRVLAGEAEIQPLKPVRVSFLQKGTVAAAQIGEETLPTGGADQNASEEQPEGGEAEEQGSHGGDQGSGVDGEGTDSEKQEKEKIQVYHVDTENETVEDMNAMEDEDGNAVIDAPHFSYYAVETRSVREIGSQDAWNQLRNDINLLSNPEENAGTIISVKLLVDIEFSGEPIWLDKNRNLVLDLNGHTISYAAGQTKSLFRVGEMAKNGNGYGGSLTIKDSSPVRINDIEEGSGLPAKVEFTAADWNNGYHGSYNPDTKTVVYYLTKSNGAANAEEGTLTSVSDGTVETTYKHTISFAGVGAVENTNSEKAPHLIAMANNGTLTIEGGRLTNLYGNAIEAIEDENRAINITNGYLVGNGTSTCFDWGGAIHMDGSGSIHVGEGAVIAGNKSKDLGGGIHADLQKRGTLRITVEEGSVIAGNECSGNGGGISITGAELTIEGGSICSNEAKTDGGGINVNTGTLMLNGGSVTNNYATSGGGGIHVNGSLNMSGGVIAGNTAGWAGGGLYISQADSGTISGGIIASNRARAEGGGIRLDTGHVIMEAANETWNLIYITNNTTISNTGNNQDWGGGGIFISDNKGQMTIYDSVVTKNTARGFGGGVSGCSTGRLSIEETRGSAVYGNVAEGSEQGLSGGGSTKSEDHDAFNSEVFNAIENGQRKKDFQDIFSALNSIVGPKMLGGGLVNWTGSCDGAFITDTDRTREIISTKQLGLSAHPDAGAITGARNTARVFISGNYSGTHGGGIMCNGLIILGQKKTVLYNDSLTIDFPKEYLGVSGNTQNPTDGQFQFELLDKDGKRLAVFSTTASPNTSGTNVLGILGINFVDASKLSEINSTEIQDVTGDEAIGHHIYYLKEIIPEEQDFMQYDETIYKIEFDVGCQGRKIVLGPNYEIKQYWLYIDDNANKKVSVVDEIKGDEIQNTSVEYEFIVNNYSGGTGHKGGHLSIKNKTIKDGDQSTSSPTFRNEDKVRTLTLEIVKTNALQGENGYMSYVNFQLSGLTDGKKNEDIFKANGQTDDFGKLQLSSIPNVKGLYLLEETVPDGFEQAGPWIVEADGEDELSVYEAKAEEASDGTKKYGKGDEVDTKREEENGAIKFALDIANTPILYSLPETGGSGFSLYTMAGAMFLLLGAGLLYRKKFSERRAKNL